MRRLRLSTLMLLVLIAAMGTALVAMEWRHRQREAAQDAKQTLLLDMLSRQFMKALKEKDAELAEERSRHGYGCRIE